MPMATKIGKAIFSTQLKHEPTMCMVAPKGITISEMSRLMPVCPASSIPVLNRLTGALKWQIKHIAEKPQEYTPGANKSPAQREPYGAMVISGVSPDPKGEEPAAEGYTSKAMLTPPYRVIVAHTPGQVNP